MDISSRANSIVSVQHFVSHSVGWSFPALVAMAITFVFLLIDGICFVRIHLLSMSRSEDLALLPIML